MSELLTTQIAWGRVDRVESILSLLVRSNEANYFSEAMVDDVLYHAISQAASRGNLGAIRKICRITGTAGYDLSIAKQHAAIRLLLFQNENPNCVEALRELGFNEGFSQVFDLIKSGVTRQVFERGRSTQSTFTVLQRNFFFAALSGNLEEVKRILDVEQTNLYYLYNVLDVQMCSENIAWPYCSSDEPLCSPPLCAAAARGHWKVVKAILTKCSLFPGDCYVDIEFFCRDVVTIAAQRNDLSIFSETFAELDNAIWLDLFVSVLFREAQPEFMEKMMLLRSLRQQPNPVMDFHPTSLHDLICTFRREVQSHAHSCHLKYLLLEMFAKTYASVKVLAPFLLDLILETKRVSVIKQVLLFNPRFFMDDAFIDLEDYKFDRCCESLWRRGVRLLVEAGVKASSPVPAEHTELFSLSLQDRCLITVRCCLKLPVRESVQKLPLPPTLKRRLLYRFWFSADTQMKCICETYPSFRCCLSGHSSMVYMHVSQSLEGSFFFKVSACFGSRN